VITQSLDAVVLLFPIITPLWFASPNCRDELHEFREGQNRLGQQDLILPVYYRQAPLMQEADDAAPLNERDAATLLRRLQFEDWRALRRTDETDLAYPAAIERLAERAAPVLRLLRQAGLRGGAGGVPSAATSAETADPSGQPQADITGQEAAGGGPDSASAPATIPVCVVDAMGRGDFTTILEALKQAPAGACVMVRPVHYNESLVMDRPIELIGEGDRDDIFIEGTRSETLTFDTNIGIVRNVTLRQRGDDNYCVWIKQGRLNIEECEITSRSLACLSVSSAADPRIRRNRIHDGAIGGILLKDDARGTYEDNDIFANTQSGIQVSGRSDPIIRCNRIHNGRQSGIFCLGRQSRRLRGQRYFFQRELWNPGRWKIGSDHPT
jgi:F-box protein 11